jgi:hypothetical protein
MRRILITLISLTLLAAACGDDGGGSAAAWCDRAQQVEDLSNSLDSPTDYRAFRDAVDDIKGSAPSEISDAVDTTADFLDMMADALEDNDDNIILAFDEVQQEVDLEEMTAAGDAIEEYNARECGIGTSDADDSDGFDDSDPFSGDDPFSDSDDDDSDEFEFGDSIVGSIADSLGVTEDQARCLVEELDLGASGEPDLSGMFDVLGECDISVADLAG